MKSLALFILIQLVAWGLIVGGYVLKRWFDPRNRARRALEGVRDARIRELTAGTWSRVTGRVASLQALQPSPVDQRSCIGFRLVVETAIRGDPSNGFRQILTRESCQAFSIADETGTAIVEGPFTIGLDVDDSSWTDLPPALFKLLDDAGVAPNLTNLRFSETFLLPGDLVTVLGAVSVEIHPQGERSGFRDPPTRRRISGKDGTPVLLRDAVDDLQQGS
jgi:hypothetical protein